MKKNNLLFDKLYREHRGILVTECSKARENLDAKDGNTVSMEDLMQEAMCALLSAIDGFDEDNGEAKFSTYLTICVKNRLHDYCRKNSRSYSISQKANKLLCEATALMNQGKTVEEIAAELDRDVATIVDVLKLNAGSVSLDRQISDDGDETMERFVGFESPKANPEIEILLEVLEREAPSEEKNMFCDFYGVAGREKLKMAEIVKAYPSYSESTIRRRIKSFENVLFPKVRKEILAYRLA